MSVRIEGGQIVYGNHGMSQQKVAEFMRWVAEKRLPIYRPILLKYTPGTCEFNAVWDTLADMVGEWNAIQTEFLLTEG